MFNTFLFSDSAAQSRINAVSLVLRLGLAVIFLYHGSTKIAHEGGADWVTTFYGQQAERTEGDPARSRPHATEVPASLSFAGTQLAVAWGEFLGGLALLLGLLTRLAALGLIIIQIGAIYLVTAPRGFSLERNGGYEYNLALIAMCLALVVVGAGRWSLDWVDRPKRKRVAVEAQAQPTAPPQPAATPALAGPHTTPASQPVQEHATPGGV
jgi:putative oxidoreductase